MDRSQLSPRETSVASLLALGMTNAEIAQRLDISVSTVKQNVTTVLIKWDCANRTQVAVEASRTHVPVSLVRASPVEIAADPPFFRGPT